MPKYTIGQAARLMGVSPDTMRRWADAGRVRAEREAGGHRAVDGVDLARFAVELAQAQNREQGRSQSLRNHVSGIITGVKKDEVVAQVELQAGPYRFVSLVTREAVDDLGLETGMAVDAVIKATNVSIEVPRDL